MRREHSGHSRVTVGGQEGCRAWWEGMWHTGLTSAREGGAKVWELVEIEGRGLGNRFICDWCKRRGSTKGFSIMLGQAI